MAANCIERGRDDVAGVLRETASQERKQGAIHKGLSWISRAGSVEGDGAVVSLAVFAPDAMGWRDRGQERNADDVRRVITESNDPVVEDEPLLRDSTSQQLASLGYRVLATAEGPHALELLSQIARL